LAKALRAYEDPWWETVYPLSGAEFDVAQARHFFGPDSPFRYRAPGGWHVLLIEELEYLSPQCQRFCKDAFERDIRGRRVVVVATSNAVDKLEQALVDRFTPIVFDGGKNLWSAFSTHLVEIWWAETGGRAPLPSDWQQWGWLGDGFSVRRALDMLECHAAMVKLGALEREGVPA
jgi:hypothetical protein